MSEQDAAAASQNFTCPGFTIAPALTVAVSVTTLPDATVVTGFPPEVTAIVVVVAVEAHAFCVTAPNTGRSNASVQMTLLRPMEPGQRKVVERRGPKNGLDMMGLAGVKLS
jgi:hypothetical protein